MLRVLGQSARGLLMGTQCGQCPLAPPLPPFPPSGPWGPWPPSSFASLARVKGADEPVLRAHKEPVLAVRVPCKSLHVSRDRPPLHRLPRRPPVNLNKKEKKRAITNPGGHIAPWFSKSVLLSHAGSTDSMLLHRGIVLFFYVRRAVMQ